MITPGTHLRLLLVFLSCLLPGLATAELSETIQRIKPSILVVGTYYFTRYYWGPAIVKALAA